MGFAEVKVKAQAALELQSWRCGLRRGEGKGAGSLGVAEPVIWAFQRWRYGLCRGEGKGKRLPDSWDLHPNSRSLSTLH